MTFILAITKQVLAIGKNSNSNLKNWQINDKDNFLLQMSSLYVLARTFSTL